jgi:hypothetical protein
MGFYQEIKASCQAWKPDITHREIKQIFLALKKGKRKEAIK